MLAVAYSGGRDSTALLHATLQAAQGTGLRVLALHVHHGLSARADDWAAHCEAQSQRWARHGWPVQFRIERLKLQPSRGDSIEAVARKARYAALRRMALDGGATLVLLAHHRRDQAETFVLQALRGSGAAGLSAMPSIVERDGVVWARPWLSQPHTAIDAYVARFRLAHIEDDSNADPRFARNRLRLEVWPALVAAFPQAEASLADAAQRAQDAHASAADLAAIDLASCAGPQGLNLKDWRRLAPYRASHALRAWLRSLRSSAITAADTERLMSELSTDGPAVWRWGDGELRRYRGWLTWHPKAPTVARPLADVLPREAGLSVRRAGRYRLPGWGGSLVIERVKSQGLPLSRLAQVELAERRGGEDFQGQPDRPPRSLKKQFQMAAVPAWQRHGPLLYEAGELLFVPGLGIDARRWAPPGEPQVAVRWEGAAPTD